MARALDRKTYVRIPDQRGRVALFREQHPHLHLEIWDASVLRQMGIIDCSGRKES